MNENHRKIIWWMIVFILIFGIIKLPWAINHGLARKDNTISIIVGIIAIIVSIVIKLSPVSFFKSIPHSDEIMDNKSNEGDSNEEYGNGVENQSQEEQNQKIGRNAFNTWWNRYRKRISIYLVAIGLCILLFVFGYRFIENRKQQKQFAVLNGNFNNQIKYELTYKNACEQITDDYNLLQRMVKMIQDKPSLGDSSYYIEQFHNQADIAIKKIVEYMHDPETTSLERNKRCSEYRSQKDSINNMRNKFKL